MGLHRNWDTSFLKRYREFEKEGLGLLEIAEAMDLDRKSLVKHLYEARKSLDAGRYFSKERAIVDAVMAHDGQGWSIGLIESEILALRARRGDISDLADHTPKVPLRRRAKTAKPVREMYPAIRRVVAPILEESGLTLEHLTGRVRTRPILEARWKAIAAISLAYPHRSMAWIGAFFGLHPTSVLSALRKMGLRQKPQPQSQDLRQAA